LIGKNDVYIYALSITNKNFLFDAVDQHLHTVLDHDMVSICWHIKKIQDDLYQETIYLDNLLQTFHQYYDLVRSKHRLNLEVLAGFAK